MNNSLFVYNSLKGKKELFKPIFENYVGMYICGPTVYNYVHLGNCRTFISFDLIYRYLKHLGYKVRYVRNITDAGHLENDEDEGEDRIAKKARLEKIEPMEVVQRYTVDFHDKMDKFNVLPPSIEPTATGHIIEQIELIKLIINNGFAYEVNGSVYFDVLKFNRENHYPLCPDCNGHISLPNNILRMDVSYGQIYRTSDVVRREGKLYDKLHHTFIFGSCISMDITWLFPFEEVPPVFKRYITHRASRRAATQLVNNAELTKLIAAEEAQSRAACMEYECNQGDNTSFGTPDHTAYRAYHPYRTLAR